VRAMQSFTASQMYCCSQLFTSPTSMHADGAGSRSRVRIWRRCARSERLFRLSRSRKIISSCEAAERGERLLHDTQNLPGALEPYCDLLSRPDLLKPERREFVVSVSEVGTQMQIKSSLAAISAVEIIESKLCSTSILDCCAEFPTSPQRAGAKDDYQSRDG
jgi:hypothetical protein